MCIYSSFVHKRSEGSCIEGRYARSVLSASFSRSRLVVWVCRLRKWFPAGQTNLRGWSFFALEGRTRKSSFERTQLCSSIFYLYFLTSPQSFNSPTPFRHIHVYRYTCFSSFDAKSLSLHLLHETTPRII